MGKPDKRFKAGACIATVFVNEHPTDKERTSLQNISLQRVYKDRDGLFKYTTSFKPSDIPKAVLVLCKAYEYVAMDPRYGGE